MATLLRSKIAQSAHLTRLGALAQLAPEEIQALQSAASTALVLRPRKEISGEGAKVHQPRLLLSGWAARVRYFADGRRQLLHLLLPGDLIDSWQRPGSRVATAVIALTELAVVAAPCPLGIESGLAHAYALSAEIEQHYLFRQIARLGRLDAYERLADLLLELSERLQFAGLADRDAFPLPITQEMLADCLGLTSVHLNRTLQLMRRENVIELRGNMVRLVDPAQLRAVVDFQPAVAPFLD